ncbi:predicted protein [Verticillium alfalfae VaMs.102]|uniref:Predicted protein n=1 Tax=Verticillium alfalfae (strain VaMs.102 / ATCC MYA-4576 / FGSC 10136) TaxID=526221 RepID=C9SM58_VERA1|nr:predicted protein [Verticillium alfalfae VaMs.102]EEY19873.1 predicted protein [Verticillium alfalfae VaMs.102]
MKPPRGGSLQEPVRGRHEMTVAEVPRWEYYLVLFSAHVRTKATGFKEASLMYPETLSDGPKRNILRSLGAQGWKFNPRKHACRDVWEVESLHGEDYIVMPGSRRQGLSKLGYSGKAGELASVEGQESGSLSAISEPDQQCHPFNVHFCRSHK